MLKDIKVLSVVNMTQSFRGVIPSLSRRLLGLFLLLGAVITTLFGYQVWQSWAQYSATKSIYHQAHISMDTKELMHELQLVRLRSMQYRTAKNPEDQAKHLAQLLSARARSFGIATDLQAELSEFSSVLPMHLQRFAHNLPEQLSIVEKSVARIEQEHEGRDITRSLSSVIEFLFSGLYARTEEIHINRSMRDLYELARVQESLGLLRTEGALWLLQAGNHDPLYGAFQRLNETINHLGYSDDVLRDVVVNRWKKSEEWGKMLSWQEAFLQGRMGEYSLTSDQWVHLVTVNIDRVEQYAREIQETLSHDLLDQQDEAKIHLALFVSIWMLLTLALVWLYWVWMVRWFIGGFRTLSDALLHVQTQMAQSRFEPVQLPKRVVSQELMALVAVINELLSQLTWQEARHQSLQQKLHQDRLLTIGNMAASMAHEINNPIAGIMMNLTYLSKVVTDDDVREVVMESLGESERVSKLIKSMLNFSRQSGSNQHVCQLTPVLEEIVLMTQGILKAGGVKLELNLEVVRDRYVLASPDSLKQILVNLINNAVQAMESVPVRIITLDACMLPTNTQQVVVRVADTGTGIPEALKEKIFDPFFTTKPADKGTGLGLSICMKLAEDMGSILALDETYTKGARFLLYLPVQDEIHTE